MAYKLRKRLEIDVAQPVIVRETDEVERHERTIDRNRADSTALKLKLRPLLREYLCLNSVPKTKWSFLKAAGGSKTVADRLEQSVIESFHDLQSSVSQLERRISRYTEAIQEQIVQKQQAKFRLNRAKQMPNPVITLDSDRLEADLAVCDTYVKGSLKLKLEESIFGSTFDTYRVTYQTPELIAHCARGYETSRKISPINVDITFHDGSSEVNFRSVSGLSKRYLGYGNSNLLHPHMTSPSTPCLGDFGGPIQDACDDFDIVSIVTLVGMFLQQFDPEDGAGRHYYSWPRYEAETVTPERTDIWQRTDGVNETLDDIFVDEDRCEADYADEYVRSY